jgi:AbrB family looped-hinge helix DNA binding protein
MFQTTRGRANATIGGRRAFHIRRTSRRCFTMHSSASSAASIAGDNKDAMKTIPTQERIGRVGQRRQVVIPRDILDTLKLQAGDLVAFSKQPNGVLIKPKRVVDPEDTLTIAEAKIVRRGEAQLKRGESKPWNVVKRAIPR